MAGLDKSVPDLPARAEAGWGPARPITTASPAARGTARPAPFSVVPEPACRSHAPAVQRRRSLQSLHRDLVAPRYRRRSRASRGFSLIEVLVVIAVLAVATGIAVVAVRGVGIERTLEREARRFVDFARLACDRAVATGREHGLHVATRRYGASLPRRGAWTLERGGALAPIEVAEGVVLVLARDDVVVEIGVALDGEPQLVCLPSGELTPFELRFAAIAGAAEERVRGRFDGRVERVADGR
jgi:general secretion pathway protein H